MISVVTGTYNRIRLLDRLIKNTVGNSDRLELVLVDGGSTDGTVEYIKSLNNPQIKLIETGRRSSYPHFMNIGIRSASHELIAQWNDDVVLTNTWGEVFAAIDDHDFYIFSWKECDKNFRSMSGWNLLDNPNETVLNYGIYNKRIFREIGMYYGGFKFYYADADMSYRAKCFGYSYKPLHGIKVLSVKTDEQVVHAIGNDKVVYNETRILYEKHKLPDGIDYI